MLRAVCAAALLTGCAAAPPEPADRAQVDAALAELPLDDASTVLVGAGDIARCGALEPTEATAELIEAVIDAVPQTLVFTTGDNAYESGSAIEFEECYEPTWGRFNERTIPTPGNHDYRTENGAPYYEYFEFYERHPEARRGYHSFQLGSWHVVKLNTNIPMSSDSPQVRWLEVDLEANAAECVLAFWHHPLFTSGFHGLWWRDRGRDTGVFWEQLEQVGADLVINGHVHLFERFAPQTHEARPSPSGIRQLIVGSGGAELDSIARRQANRAYVNNRVHGVLVLILRERSYEWAFLGIDGIVHDRSEAAVPCVSRSNDHLSD